MYHLSSILTELFIRRPLFLFPASTACGVASVLPRVDRVFLWMLGLPTVKIGPATPFSTACSYTIPITPPPLYAPQVPADQLGHAPNSLSPISDFPPNVTRFIYLKLFFCFPLCLTVTRTPSSFPARCYPCRQVPSLWPRAPSRFLRAGPCVFL